jgi:NADH:ubiquinone oxidoreductase subunit F (NADH-binding)/NADH:ubiquinone oxidoreductase subunit E
LTSLIRELVALQEQDGWLRDERLVELAERLQVPLHRLQSLGTYYTFFRRSPPGRPRVAVCRDLSCMLAGGDAAGRRLRDALAARADVEVVPVSCPGRCDRAPVALAAGRVVRTTDPGAAERVLVDGPDAQTDRAADATGFDEADPCAAGAERYGALRAAVRREPGWLIAELEAAGLRGMGGAGFPTARKWQLVAAQAATPRFVVCNADESEPGTFKDREIVSRLPHLVLEGMALAATEVGAEQGFVFIRHEYGPERARLEAAIGDARARGALGSDVFGSGRPFDVEVFVSPGGYILGEESALLECMEDRRGEPRNKPPFPGTTGLHGRPTLINNVETFAHAAAIAHRGRQWWSERGAAGFAGHKFISVSGDVTHPGVHLVPFGASFASLLDRCGGMRDGRPLVAFAPGGASSRFLGPEALDTLVDFDAVARAGSMLGSGAAVFVGEGHDLLDVGLSVTRFFRNESCGKCVPCRVGTDKAVKLVEAEGGLSDGLRDRLEGLQETLAATSLCGLGQVALAPLLSLAERFPDRVGRSR